MDYMTDAIDFLIHFSSSSSFASSLSSSFSSNSFTSSIFFFYRLFSLSLLLFANAFLSTSQVDAKQVISARRIDLVGSVLLHKQRFMYQSWFSLSLILYHVIMNTRHIFISLFLLTLLFSLNSSHIPGDVWWLVFNKRFHSLIKAINCCSFFFFPKLHKNVFTILTVKISAKTIIMGLCLFIILPFLHTHTKKLPLNVFIVLPAFLSSFASI